MKRILFLTLAVTIVIAILPMPIIEAASITYTEVVSPKYDRTGDFSEGIASVCIGGKWGFIDKTGKEVISLKYDEVRYFFEGMALVRIDGKWGFVDKAGEEVIPLKYDEARSFSEGMASVCISGKWGFVDKTGKEVISLKYDNVYTFSEGTAGVWVGNWPNVKCGFIDHTGREVVPLKYGYVDYFSEGFARVSSDYVSDDRKWGFVDKAGNEVIPLKYEHASDFTDGLAYVTYKSIGAEGGYIDKSGKEIVSLVEDYVPSNFGELAEGMIPVVSRHNYKEGYLDITGMEVVPMKYDGARCFSEGMAMVCVQVAGGYVPHQYCKYGFVDKTGIEVVPLKYDKAFSFSEGFAAVCNDAKWGFVDKFGKEVIPLEYEEASSFSEGLAAVRSGNKTGFISISVAASPDDITAVPAVSIITVNSRNVSFEAYNINGNNFFKLRDLAYVINGSEKQFGVSYDNRTKVITLTRGDSYTSVGGEMVQGDGIAKTATPSLSRIYLDGIELNLIVYNISGNNFFKLRDLMEAINVYVGYNNETKAITLDTSKGYI